MARVAARISEAMPWVGRGPICACNERAAARLDAELGALGFRVVELEGERIVNHASFVALFTAALGFPSDARRDWASLSRVGAAELDPPPGERVALLWRRADHSAAFCLKCVLEAGWFIVEWARDLRAGERGMQLELFVLGQTRDFPEPPRGWKAAR